MSEYCENCRTLQAENNRLKNYTCGFTDCVYQQKGKKLEAEISVLRSANKSLEVKVEALEAAITNLRDGNEYILVRELRERIEELEPKAHQFDLLKESGTGIFNTEYVRKLEAVVKASKWYGVELDKVERELEERLNRK